MKGLISGTAKDDTEWASLLFFANNKEYWIKDKKIMYVLTYIVHVFSTCALKP